MIIFATYSRRNRRCQWECCGKQDTRELAEFWRERFTEIAHANGYRDHEETIVCFEVNRIEAIPETFPANHKF